MASDRTKLSFAEAEGRARFPSVLNWGELDERLRAALWNRFWIYFDRWVEDGEYGHASYYRPPLSSILVKEFVHRRHGFANEFREHYDNKEKCLVAWAALFRSADYVELFDFITFFLRDRECPKELIDRIAGVLDESWSPYRLLRNPPTIIPAVSPEEAATLTRDLEFAFQPKFAGAKAHLQAALDALNAGDHRAVVREAIHSVESAVRDFTSDPNAMLSRALKKLSDESGLHPALAQAFEKLYAYSSDEKGIRHALVFGENEKVGFDEAIFFVSACSSFVGFLSRKASSSASS